MPPLPACWPRAAAHRPFSTIATAPRSGRRCASGTSAPFTRSRKPPRNRTLGEAGRVDPAALRPLQRGPRGPCAGIPETRCRRRWRERGAYDNWTAGRWRLILFLPTPARRGRGRIFRLSCSAARLLTVRGKVANLETSPGDASQPFGNFGRRRMGQSYGADPTRIEFIEYRGRGEREPAAPAQYQGRTRRTSSIFDTCRLQLAREATVTAEPPARRFQ